MGKDEVTSEHGQKHRTDNAPRKYQENINWRRHAFSYQKTTRTDKRLTMMVRSSADAWRPRAARLTYCLCGKSHLHWALMGQVATVIAGQERVNVMTRTLLIIGLTTSLLVLGACSGLGMETAHPVQLQVLNKSSRPLSFCFASQFPKCESEIPPKSFDVGTIFVNKVMSKDEVLRLFDEETLLICGARVDIRAIRAVIPTFEIIKGERYQI